MKKISVYTNQTSRHRLRKMKIVKMLKEKGFHTIPEGEIIVVIGGDGTFLSAVKENLHKDVLFVGLNSGNLGFFSEFSYREAEKLVNLLSEENYKVEEYPIYNVEIVSKNQTLYKDIFLNDVVIERASPKIIFMKACIDNRYQFNFASDCIIVSTSTGSGAYNMASGGAVMLQKMPAFQISALGQQRNNKYKGPMNSLLVSDRAIIEFVPEHKKRRPYRVVADGREVKLFANSNATKKICIFNSNKKIKVIRTPDFDYTENTIQKLF